MRTVGELIGLSRQNEVLLLTLVGICCTIFDASIFNLHSNLYKVWSVRMDPIKFTYTVQLYIKYIISTIVIVRTFTVHLYLAFYIVMLWPAIFEERAGLLLPWLFVGSVKCLAMGAMSLLTGLYICVVYRFSKIACWDFLLTQIMDHGPSIYMWICVLNYYRDLKAKSPKIYPSRGTPSTLFDISERRRRVRGLVLDDQKIVDTLSDERQLISTSTFDTLIHQLNLGLKCAASRSLDSLLTKMTAEAKKEEFLRMSDEVEEDDTLSVQEKALKSLHITSSYIERIKNKERTMELIYPELLCANGSLKSAPDLKLAGKLQVDSISNPSETEIKAIRLDITEAIDEAAKEKRISRLPRRSKTVATSYSSLAVKERLAISELADPLGQKLISTINPPPQKQGIPAGGGVQNTKAASVSRAITVNRPVVQKSKSYIPKTDNIVVKLPQVMHTTFKQDGYTLAYLEKVKNEANKKTKEQAMVSRSKDDIK